LERCRAAASGENLPVSFAGFLNQGEMSRAYAASDALILPSDHGETWGLVVNEAMACGLPAYVSDQVGCHPDLILPGETGRVFPLGDTSTLADLLESDLNEPGRLNRMGARAREHVQRFNFAAVVTGIRKALESVGSQ
jgi:glycosyltransferase involved in cell wall biosynthesis